MILPTVLLGYVMLDLLFSVQSFVDSAGIRTNEALCWLSYEAPYLGPEGGRPDRPTQAVNSIIMSGIARNRTPSNLKMHHISKNSS